ncbi:putative poly(3-hydroxybutyrate) depolymerase [Venustampulla echinocandica]|uniref:feruloyl esterase n=1 Tax=Venustampulla echinocandica TaxID=2656787 RepID=A0A370TBD5_9HELO|nr:putative poly(3-hydroxybutyrate) depolymerase [Venustampulla echinocandica]RDL31362.1 putative poly(3-hydroxybutyrate) depolymerase [Venustampulla echinocandica]
MVYSKIASFLAIASALFMTSYGASSVGCGKDLPPSQQPPGGPSHKTDFNQTDGTARIYRIHIPSNYTKDTPVPLIFSFHGHGDTAKHQEDLSQFSNESFNPNAIAVYPQGLKDAWQGAPYAKPGVNDIGFVQDMIDYFSSRYCIDTTRIYAAGKSNGGGFTSTLACSPTLSKQIAAIAPVSGAFYIPISSPDDCSPATIPIPCNISRSPIPIIEFHGSADKVISYDGGYQDGDCLPSIPHWVREWSKRDGYGASNKTTDLHHGKVQKYEYGGGKGNLGVVTHYLTQGLGHAWPSTLPNSDNPNGTYFDATPIIIDFFNKYTL